MKNYRYLTKEEIIKELMSHECIREQVEMIKKCPKYTEEPLFWMIAAIAEVNNISDINVSYHINEVIDWLIEA